MKTDMEYIIATVGDFLKVPEDRLEDCLAEFADFIGLARDIIELAGIAGEVIGVDATAQIGPFTWKDDGKSFSDRALMIEIDGQAARPRTVAGVRRLLARRLAKSNGGKNQWQR